MTKAIVLALAAALMAGAAAAHHPGHRLDEVMGSKEKYFQAIDKEPPAFSLGSSTSIHARLRGMGGGTGCASSSEGSC